jgi:hypothetical protein
MPPTPHNPNSHNENAPVSAELVIPVAETDLVTAENATAAEPELIHDSQVNLIHKRSWVFRLVDRIGWLVSRSFGIVSIILLVAVLSNIPILNLIAFGYLLAVSGRIASTGRIRDGFLHLRKASQIGSIFIGTSLILLPAKLLSWFHSEAYLIDPTSNQTDFLKIALVVVIVLSVPHVMAAWFCGGKLRHFFWPIVAPFSLALWAVKKAAGSQTMRPTLETCLSWISPHLVNDLVDAKPVTDFILPAILFKHIRNGTLISNARDQLWNFMADWKLGQLLRLGFFGFVGSFIWLAPPTLLMFRAIGYDDGLAVLCGIAGVLMATVVFGMLPFLQTLFAETEKFSSFFDLGEVYSRFMRSPLMHMLSLLVLLLLALPLFVFKVEEIPPELLWTISLVFVVFGLPGRLLTGWAVGRAKRRTKVWAWWYRWPIVLATPLVSFAFAFLFFFSPYVAWYGGYSLFENHAFLLPAPFWVSYFV